MSSTEPLTIQYGLPDQLREAAAAIYYDGFQQKFATIMSRQEASQLLPLILNPQQLIIACAGEELVGLAGIQHHQKRLFQFPTAPFSQTFGFVRGQYVRLMLQAFSRPYAQGELLMDGICVAASRRGQGIGTLLLTAVVDFARSHGYQSVRLDVVDVNQNARRLYERFGFVATTTHHYPYLAKSLGFSESTTMIYKVEETS